MSVFTYLKRNRTLYRNLIEKEILAGRSLLDQDTGELDLNAVSHKVETCIKRLNEFTDKLDKTNERMSVESVDDLEQLITLDSSLIEKAFDCRGELESLFSSLQDVSRPSHAVSTMTVTDETINQMQTQMQHLGLDQHQQPIDQNPLSIHRPYSSVKLPKLEIPIFNGDKMKWKEFWDTFESTVDQNPTLSDIEKLHYLNSKLSGDAKNAIAGILLSNENYSVVTTLLKERFGDKQSVVKCHYTELINIIPANNNPKGLRSLYDQIEKHLRSLEALQQDINQDVFISIITSKIPKDILVQLELQKGAKNEWTVRQLRDLLNNYVCAREKAEQQSSTGISTSRHTVSQPPRLSTEALIVQPRAQARSFERNRAPGLCRYCNGSHWNDECMRYPTADARKRKIKGSCYICLKQGHKINECTLNKDCYYCHESNNHHRSLCPQKFGNEHQESINLVEEFTYEGEPHSLNTTENALLSAGETVIMQTARSDVKNPRKDIRQSVRMLFDTGSHRTYISESLAKALDLKMGDLNYISLVTFGSDKPKKVPTHSTKLDITLKDGTTLTITANVVPSITGTIQRGPVYLKSWKTKALLGQYTSTLADTFPHYRENTSIDLLISNDYYLDLILPQRVELQPGLYLLESKLGWIITGRSSEFTIEKQEANMLILTYGTEIGTETNLFTEVDKSLPIKANLEDFWKLETIGIHDSAIDPKDDEVLKSFRETLRYDGGRYYVDWPWKNESSPLPENRELAFGRLKSLVCKLRKNPDLVKQYNEIIQDQLRLGIIEKVKPYYTEGLKHYIPHHAVINPSNVNTKVRVVYDASAKDNRDHKSLNECLYRGPVLLQDLTGILLRFRLNKVAIVADIEKAFLQIGLNDSAKNTTRFFWLKDANILNVENNIQVYRFCRVPFGIISSPFLLGATLDFHLKAYQSDIAENIRKNIYVDNVITGTKSTEEAIDFYKTAKQIFAQASMNLRDWTSNDTKVLDEIPLTDKFSGEKMKVLGLTWIVTNDQLSLHPVKLDSKTDSTKRTVLKQISSVYDPLGLFCPATLKGKLFLQELWNKRLGWDETLSGQDNKTWSNIGEDLMKLSYCRFPKYIGLCDETSDDVVYRLVGFCDASKHAYAAVVYLHQRPRDRCRSDLVFSKVRLSPSKNISIPRLELLAALIGTRSVEFVATHLRLDITQKHIWIDSQCVLDWISKENHSSRFVENRITEIRKHQDITFHYIASTDNPADIASRGKNINELLENKLWWHGPHWLVKQDRVWEVWNRDNSNSETKKSEVIYEAKLFTTETIKMDTNNNGPFEIDCKRYSSLTKLLRVTSLVFRFITKIRHKPSSNGPIDATEMQCAEESWIKFVQRSKYNSLLQSIVKNKPNNIKTQLGVYLDEKGLLRCQGRLDNLDSGIEAKQPLLLPKKDSFTDLIINHIHKGSHHTGVSQTLARIRKTYWIPQGRASVRRVLKYCLICRRWEGGPYQMPPMPPLPRKRVQESVPFSHSGINYFGPLYIRINPGTKKVWACLFTCLVTRAVHLELIQDMSTEQFLLGFRRFVANHGNPCEIISDNAPQFKLASDTIENLWSRILRDKDVISYSTNEKIKWRFIVELAPWMGGFYERLIGLVKRSLRKAIGKLCLTNDQLLTVLKEAEAIINSRPLVYIGDDINSGITLTPAHFLSLNPHIGLPNCISEDLDENFNPNTSSAESLARIWKKGMKHVDKFWQVWKNDYLLSLRERYQRRLKAPRIQSSASPHIGHVVLVKDDLPRGCWKIGRITELIKSSDNQIRSAKIMLPSRKLIGRPLNLLFPIECSGDAQDVDNNESYDTEARVSSQTGESRKKQPTRQAAARARQLIRHQLNETDDIVD